MAVLPATTFLLSLFTWIYLSFKKLLLIDILYFDDAPVMQNFDIQKNENN